MMIIVSVTGKNSGWLCVRVPFHLTRWTWR